VKPREAASGTLAGYAGVVAHMKRTRHASEDLIWDDRAEQAANQLAALLFVAATPLRRTEIAETLRIARNGYLGRVQSCTPIHPAACVYSRPATSWGWRRRQTAPRLSNVIWASQAPSHCPRLRWTRWRSSPTSSPSPVPIYVPSAAWTATPLSKRCERAAWLPRIPALVGVAGQAFSSPRRHSCAILG